MTDPSVERPEAEPVPPGSSPAPEPATASPTAAAPAPAPAPAAPVWGAPVAPAPAAPPWDAPAAPVWGAPTPPAPGAPAWGGPPQGAVPVWGIPGLAPVPLPRPGGPSGWRTTILSAVIMIGVVFGVNVVNAAVPLPSDPTVVVPVPITPVDPNPPTQAPNPPTQDPNLPTPDPNQPTPQPAPTAAPVDPGPVAQGTALKVGAGVVIYMPEGWTVIGSDNGVTVLQKGGVVMISAGIAWGGTPIELATGYRDSWFEGGQFSGTDPESGSIGNGVPGAVLSYVGIIEGTQVDGIIVTGATGGAGAVFNVFGAQGSLKGVSDDINTVLGTVQFTGDPG